MQSTEQANPDDIYPVTARWGWDEQHGQHYFSIRCADAWCLIGASGFTPREPRMLSGDVERTVPGWFDEQHLAVWDSSGATPRLRPGPWATIYPTSNLRHLTDTDFMVMRHVADIRLDLAAASGPYRAKFNLDVDGTSQIWLEVLQTDAIGVEFRNSAAGSAKKAVRTGRMLQVLHAAEGAVRWRWHRDDETAWIWCRSCCDSGNAPS